MHPIVPTRLLFLPLLVCVVALTALPAQAARKRPAKAAPIGSPFLKSSHKASASRKSKPQAQQKAKAPTAVKLDVAPPRINLSGPLARHRVLATVLLSDGTQKDVSADVVLSSSKLQIAAVEDKAIVAQGDGDAFVAVRHGKLKTRIPVHVTDSQRPLSYSFRNDVIPIMAHIGCSAGSCHGANSGKAGFKLSLRGYAPEQDLIAIARQYRGRRISREAPEKSLILRKPLLEIKHGGGRVLEKDSRAYSTILGWLRQGAPGLDDKDPKLMMLSMFPGDRIYRPNERQQILIRATFSDGHQEDVTERALFRSNDVAVATVSDAGEIVAGSPGATAIQAKYMDKLAVLNVTVPFPQKVNPDAFKERNNSIDDAVYAKLQELNLEPSGLCTDAEFLRRVYIDALGTLPATAEARAFLDNRDADKRNKLIDEVLARPEYGSVWALKLADLFLMRKEHMQRKNTLALQQWITNQFRENRAWDKIATDLITASGSTQDLPQTLWYISRQQIRPNGRGWIRHYELTGEIASQVFLGTRIGCTKCHNHPTEKYTQDDYYHFAAIFAQVNGDGDGDPVPARILPNDAGEVQHPRTAQVMSPRPLDRMELVLKGKEDRRVKFARWMTQGPGREQFARNIVNRIWARLFGSGIVEPVDDLRSTNPPKNKQLLDTLSKDLIAHNYDLKYLTATIMKSRTYQASSTPTKANRVDSQFFSHYPVRRLPAEELIDAVAQVTGVPDKFATYPLGTRAIELSDIELNSEALDTFGRPTRIMPLDCERNNAPSMSQALELFNGEALQNKLKNGEGNLAQLLKVQKENEPVIEELFLSAFARRPTPQELSAVLATVKAAPNREEGMQDVLWALLNSKEFMFNH